MSPPYPGSLGSLFSSQGSWESLRHVSLGPSLFPGKRVISEACLGRDVPGPPCISALGVSDLQHFGKRPDSSELSFLLGALGYLSLLRTPLPAASGAISSPGGGCLLVVGGLALAMRKSLQGRLYAGLLWDGGLFLARGVPRRVCLPVGRRGLCLLRFSEWGGGPCLSRVLGGGVGRGVLGTSGAHTGVVFLLVSATSHRLAPPGKGPRPAPTPPPSLALRAQSR